MITRCASRRLNGIEPCSWRWIFACRSHQYVNASTSYWSAPRQRRHSSSRAAAIFGLRTEEALQLLVRHVLEAAALVVDRLQRAHALGLLEPQLGGLDVAVL